MEAKRPELRTLGDIIGQTMAAPAESSGSGPTGRHTLWTAALMPT